MTTVQTVTHSLSWEEIARCIFRDKGITSGLWKVGVELGFAAANAGPSSPEIVPAGMVAVRAVVISRASEPGPLTYDASQRQAASDVRGKTSAKKVLGAAKKKRAS
jgi:hypothetical protein